MDTTHGDVKRDTRPYRGYTISVTTERMDGGWAAVARAVHESESSREVFPVPVSDRRFPSERDAQEFAFQVARDWIDENTPRQ
jgi:hypothetical protein